MVAKRYLLELKLTFLIFAGVVYIFASVKLFCFLRYYLVFAVCREYNRKGDVLCDLGGVYLLGLIDIGDER